MFTITVINTHTDDATRVKLLEGPDYINANYVNVSVPCDLVRYLSVRLPIMIISVGSMHVARQ